MATGNALVGSANSADNNFTPQNNVFIGLGGCAVDFHILTEAVVQIPWGSAQTLSGMWINLARNNQAGTWALRQNNATPLSGPSVVIAGLANQGQDTTHTLALSQNDVVSVLQTTSSILAFLDASGVSFAGNTLAAPVSNTHGIGVLFNGVNVTGNATRWYDLSGESNESAVDGAALVRFKQCTLSRLAAYSNSNTFGVPQTFNLRKNQSTNMNCTIVFPGGQTGRVLDVTHQDSVNDNDVVYVQGQNAALAGAFNLYTTCAWQTISVTQTLGGIGSPIAGWNSNGSGNDNFANLAPFGYVTGTTSKNLEVSTGANVTFAATWLDLRLGACGYSGANGVLTVTSNFNDISGSGGFAGNQVLSIFNGASQDFEDTTHQDSIPANPNGRQLTYRLTAGLTNTGTLTFKTMTSQLNGITPPIPAGAVSQGGRKAYTRIWGNFH